MIIQKSTLSALKGFELWGGFSYFFFRLAEIRYKHGSVCSDSVCVQGSSCGAHARLARLWTQAAFDLCALSSWPSPKTKISSLNIKHTRWWPHASSRIHGVEQCRVDRSMTLRLKGGGGGGGDGGEMCVFGGGGGG